MIKLPLFPGMNNPTSLSSETSTEQEQETSSDCLRTRQELTCLHLRPVIVLSTLCLLLLVACVSLSVLYTNESTSDPEWEGLLFDYQNISDRYLTISKVNSELKRDNDIMTERSTWLHTQYTLLNRTTAKLMSVNLALSSESTELTQKIVNLTNTNLHLAQEHERLVRYTSEQDQEKLNMSQTIANLVDSCSRQEEDNQRLAEMNNLLRDELVQVKSDNRNLMEINVKFQEEVKNLSTKIGELLNQNGGGEDTVADLQKQNQNLSKMLMESKKELAENKERRRNEMDQMKSLKEAYRSLDLYCPVINNKKKERICKECPESWSLFDAKCYYFSSRVLTWNNSRDWCRTQGGDLLIVNTQPEQSFIFESSQAPVQSRITRFWIGLTDAKEEGEWFWVDGSPVTAGAQYWVSREGHGTEPDDWKLENPSGEDCGHIDTTEDAISSWMDGSCTTSYRWICEKNV